MDAGIEEFLATNGHELARMDAGIEEFLATNWHE
jgi:hypothetical protein